MTLTLNLKTAILTFSFEMTCGAFGGPSVDVRIPIIEIALDFIDSHKYPKVYMLTARCLKQSALLSCSGCFPDVCWTSDATSSATIKLFAGKLQVPADSPMWKWKALLGIQNFMIKIFLFS